MAASEWVIVRLRMQDANKFIADAKASGASVRTMGKSADEASGLFDRLTHRSFWLNQALFTIRRTVYGLTLGFAAAGAAILLMGFQFNSTIEQQSIAFKRFTGSAQGATDEIKFLFNLAAHTPFEFQQVIAADRQLMAFGFTARQTRPILVALSDAMAGMGLDQSSLDRATLALGQIRSTGRLLGQDLRQLEQLGLVDPADLAKRLGVAQSAILQPGTLNIPSEKAIDAIVAFWKERFHGAGREFQRTWVGELSTLHDIGAQTFGAMVLPLQQKLEKRIIPDVTRIAVLAQRGFQQGGMHGFFEAIDRNAGLGTNLAATWDGLSKAGISLFHIVRDVGEAFLFAWRVIRPGTFILVPLAAVLSVLATVLDHLQWPLRILITLWVAERIALILATVWTRRKIAADILAWTVTKSISKAETVYIALLYLQSFALKAVRGAAILAAAATLFFEGATWGAVGALVAMTIAFFASPIGWVTLAVIGLAAAFVVLWKKWDDFRHMIQWVWDKLRDFYNWAQTHSLKDLLIPHIPHKFGSFGFHNPFDALKGGATGGTLTSGGSIMVGEHGPEIVSLPRSAQITPLRTDDIPVLHGAVGRGFRELIVKVPVSLDGRQMAEASARFSLDEAARA